MSKLGELAAKAKAEPVKATRLGQRIADGMIRGELVDIPMLGKAWIELVGSVEVTKIESDVMRRMAALELEPTAINGPTFDAEKAVDTLAVAVRDPDNHGERFGTVEEWSKLDQDIIGAAWLCYADVRRRLDPLGEELITESDAAGIRFALEKKSAAALRLYGVARLARFMLTMGDPPSSSAVPKSSDGSSSPD